MLELVEISKNYYTISGEIDTFMGTRHTNDIEDWNHYEIHIDCLDLNYKLKSANVSYFTLHKILSDKSDKITSQNEYVAAYELLFNEKKLDNRILDLRIGKNGNDISNLRETLDIYIEDVLVIPINIYEYGFQNKITIYVSPETFFDIINNKKLEDYEIIKYVKYFKHHYGINIEDLSAKDFTETLNEIRKYEKSLPKQRKGLAYNYYNKLYPNLKKGNFIINKDGDVFKVTESSIKKWGIYTNFKPVIESEYHIRVSGFKMIASGMSKRLVDLYTYKYNLICHESEYNLLATKYNLPKEPNKMSLLKIFRINNNEQGKN